jgi:hypothetical protein
VSLAAGWEKTVNEQLNFLFSHNLEGRHDIILLLIFLEKFAIETAPFFNSFFSCGGTR